jgi:hypothetical protein
LFKTDPIENSLQKLISEALLKYGQSLDSLDWEDNFLKLWRVLELITFYPELNSIEKSANRIKIIYSRSPLWKYNIDSICDLRNMLVHKGIYPGEGVEQLSILKVIVENWIWQLVIFCRHFKNVGDLRIFYELDSVTTENLKKKIKVIEKILEFRKSKKE